MKCQQLYKLCWYIASYHINRAWEHHRYGHICSSFKYSTKKKTLWPWKHYEHLFLLRSSVCPGKEKCDYWFKANILSLGIWCMLGFLIIISSFLAIPFRLFAFYSCDTRFSPFFSTDKDLNVSSFFSFFMYRIKLNKIFLL